MIRFEIVGGAEAALAALDVDDRAEAALERAAAAEIEARPLPDVALERSPAAGTASATLGDARQVLEIVVDRLQRAVPGVAQHLVEPALLGLAGEERACPCPCASWISGGISCSIDRQPETWKPPITTGSPAARNSRARSTARGELVRLHADQADQRPCRRGARNRAMIRVGHDTAGCISSIGTED